MKKPRFIVMYFGRRAAMSFPALDIVRGWWFLSGDVEPLRNGVLEDGREDC
jgi:hypothetical protein